jgi:biopolymer transport protein TolR
MGMQVGKKGTLNAEPNVVPMIDIMLVLLIIFMIVTPIISAGFTATMPLAREIEQRGEETGDVVLGISREGDYYLDPGTGKIGYVAGGQERLEEMLTQVFQSRTTDRILYFRADQNLEFGKVQEAVEIARRAGVRVLAAVTDERQEGRSIFGGGGSH